jgi:hypothetical protein
MPHNGSEPQSRTTGDVLQRLQKLGLPATLSSIAADTKVHYLPDRATGHFGRAGASGRWELWMERRAERLYRLRALNNRTKRGPSGTVLRLFLFLADGWGWEFIKEACIKGYRFSVRTSTRGVANRSRKPLTLKSLPFIAEEIAQDQRRPEIPDQAEVDRVKMTVGLLKFGVAPDSNLGSLGPLFDNMMLDGDNNDEIRQVKKFAPLIASLIDTSEENAVNVIGSADDETIQATRENFHAALLHLRKVYHRKNDRRENGKASPSSLLSFFGKGDQSRLTAGLRKGSIRCTPAQFLGGQFATMVATTHGMRRLQKQSQALLPVFLQSEEVAQWLRRMESE